MLFILPSILFILFYFTLTKKYELLRRSARYEVRRYPATVSIECNYDKRPEGYDRLASYAGGSNTDGKRLLYYAPTVMTINDEEDSGVRKKRMTWPMIYAIPGIQEESSLKIEALPDSTISRVDKVKKPSRVVAVTRFEIPATEPVVRGYTAQLLNDLKKDNLKPTEAAEKGECIVGQYDALFSLNKRRNEVWVELEEHLWN